MRDWVPLYHRLPYPLRVAAASIKGLQLMRHRYGRDTERLVEEALEREQWTPDAWNAYQENRLGLILHRAATRVPYYRSQWEDRRRRGDKASYEELSNWPVLKKEPLRSNPRAFVADDCNPRRMLVEHTSGSTGTPLSLWQSSATTRTWYAVYEARTRRWNGVSFRDRWAILGGRLVTPTEQRGPPFWVWNAGLHQLYLSSYHLGIDSAPAYVNALRRKKVTHLIGYASSIYTLALAIAQKDLGGAPLRVAISNAEPLYEQQRDVINKAFDCPLRDTYGMAELVAAASECSFNVMHLWPEVGVVEVRDDQHDASLANGATGRLICTGLLNLDMPLIRYEVGDRGAIDHSGSRCHCGRYLPKVRSIEGRLDDVILTPDGRRVGRLDPVFKSDLAIKEAQVVQESLHQIRVLVVPAPQFKERDRREIVQRMRGYVGNMSVSVELVSSISRTANGKFRAVVSKVETTG